MNRMFGLDGHGRRERRYIGGWEVRGGKTDSLGYYIQHTILLRSSFFGRFLSYLFGFRVFRLSRSSLSSSTSSSFTVSLLSARRKVVTVLLASDCADSNRSFPSSCKATKSDLPFSQLLPLFKTSFSTSTSDKMPVPSYGAMPLSKTFLLVRILQVISMVVIVGITSNFIGNIVNLGVEPPKEFVGTISIVGSIPHIHTHTYTSAF